MIVKKALLSTVIATFAASVAAMVVMVPSANSMPDSGGGSSLPKVNMEAVLKASQLDPPKSGTGITPGAGESVRRVERALVAKGLLKKRYVDGHYGSTTRSAYERWQRRLGYSGIGANGMPGKTSLTKLGKGRFDVWRIVVPGKKITLSGGSTLNYRTNQMKMEAARRLGGCTMSVTQGSYNAGGVGASAGTHDGGGAMDISVKRGCGTKQLATVRELRRVGFAAWYRPANSSWPAHIHAIAISDPDLSREAQGQVSDYYRGLNGLANDGPDNGPDVKKRTWEEYKRSR